MGRGGSSRKTDGSWPIPRIRRSRTRPASRSILGEIMLKGTCSTCWAVVVAMLATSLIAQQPQPDYTKAKSHFPNLFAPYQGRTVQKASVLNSARTSQALSDGKLRLSLSDAIALALEN